MASYDDLKRATAKAISKVFRKKTGGSPHCEISLNSSLISMFSGRNKSISSLYSSKPVAFAVFDDDESNKEEKEEEETKARIISVSLLFFEALLLSLLSRVVVRWEASFLLLVLFSESISLFLLVLVLLVKNVSQFFFVSFLFFVLLG